MTGDRPGRDCLLELAIIAAALLAIIAAALLMIIAGLGGCWVALEWLTR